MRGSRTSAPRSVSRLCRLWVAFSAMHRARWSGKWKFISAGASVPGRHLEHDPDAVDDLLLAGVGDVDRRGEQPERALGGGQARGRCSPGPWRTLQDAPYM